MPEPKVAGMSIARGACGRADLVRAAHGDPSLLPDLAELFGFERRIAPAAARLQPDVQLFLPPEELPLPPEGEVQASPDVPFWWLVSVARLAAPDDEQKAAPIFSPSLKPLRPSFIPGEPPITRPLAACTELIPRLRRCAAERAPTRSLDANAVVAYLSRGHVPVRLPCHTRLQWGGRVQIIDDRSYRLGPYWHDQDEVELSLLRLLPRGAVAHARLFDGSREPVLLEAGGELERYRCPPAGSLVLALSDLGCLDRTGHDAIRMWAELGRRLRESGSRTVALAPLPRRRWSKTLDQYWELVEWEKPDAPAGGVSASDADRAERLLRLVSPAVRIEPGFLRAVRLLLGPAEADAATEADAWQHPDVASPHPVAATLSPEARKRLLREFAAEKEKRAAVIELLQTWRARQPAEIFYEEIVDLDPAAQKHVDPATAEEARAFIKLVSAHMQAEETPPSGGLRSWARRFSARLTEAACADGEIRTAIYTIWAAADTGDANPPPGFAPHLVPSPPRRPRKRADLRQRGGDIVFLPERSSEGDARGGEGSLIASIETRNGLILVQQSLSDNDPSFWKSGRPPPWAEAWGTDEYGRWVTFSLKTEHGAVTQRLRWISPGRFWMGSPETEAQRFDNEEPRHEVTIPKGFWLFDTACTQALWEAVMEGNPSRFQGPDRPVDSVSWDDAQAFIAEINKRVRGLELVLSSEAQWEYACRAGTQTPFSFGESITPKQVNYQGKETVPVGSLPANPWGLYEMHGNVWEWCADGPRSYTADPVTDPVGPTEAGAARVLRGGAWYNFARHARSAYRNALVPGHRNFSYGFRCARVQEGAEPREAELVRAGLVRRAERRTASARTSEATGTWLRLDTDQREESCTLPQTPSFIIASDCERLTFRQMICPSWANSIGRDRFGLWVEIYIATDNQSRPSISRRRRKGQVATDRSLTQRLRWISPGRFWMGSPETEAKRDNEGPRHEVTISKGFWLFDTACTQALWEAVMGTNPSQFKGPGRPVDSVGWDDIQKFLAEINKRVPGLNLVLPSEAQWEYACRAGTETPFSFGETITPEQVNYDGNHPYRGGKTGLYRRETVAVGSLPANPWGLYEMHGNVWEWCADGQRSYTADPVTDPVGPTDPAADRVLRGGSWYLYAQFVRSAYRLANDPGSRSNFIGFRCARVQES